MRRILGEIRIWLKFLQVARNPYDTPKIFQLIDLLLQYRGDEYFEPMLEQVFSSAEVKKQYEQGLLPGFPSMEELAAMPNGSLGRVFHTHMVANKLDLNFFPLLDIKNPVKYIVYRAYLNHDVTHVLLGYDTSIPGELAIQGFTIGQTNSPISGMLIAAAILFMATREPFEILRTFRLIGEGLERGKAAVPFTALRFDELLPLPLESAREKAGLLEVEPSSSPKLTNRLVHHHADSVSQVQ